MSELLILIFQLLDHRIKIPDLSVRALLTVHLRFTHRSRPPALCIRSADTADPAHPSVISDTPYRDKSCIP